MATPLQPPHGRDMLFPQPLVWLPGFDSRIGAVKSRASH